VALAAFMKVFIIIGVVAVVVVVALTATVVSTGAEELYVLTSTVLAVLL